ncbi:hypothetical protein F4777DRAFT_266405 [Nemania sp. FL0916]|nr:hypothetical protein F4777DRAFT_266405 [Nemania sp. FL0916]
MSAQVVPKADPYGDIYQGASLEIEGTLFKAIYRYSRLGNWLWPEIMIGIPIDGFLISTKARKSFSVVPDEFQSPAEYTGQISSLDVYLLPILKSNEDRVGVDRQNRLNGPWSVSLLLIPVENDASKSIYKRHGIVELTGEGSHKMFNLGPLSRRICKPETKVMTII